MISDVQAVNNYPDDIEISASSRDETKYAVSLKSDAQEVEKNDEDIKKVSPKKSSRKLLRKTPNNDTRVKPDN